jgi:hypothetical protein
VAGPALAGTGVVGPVGTGDTDVAEPSRTPGPGGVDPAGALAAITDTDNPTSVCSTSAADARSGA